LILNCKIDEISIQKEYLYFSDRWAIHEGEYTGMYFSITKPTFKTARFFLG